MSNHPVGVPGAIHIVLQSKGGVGKSFVALHLAQHFTNQSLPTAVFDSDPATPTLANYRALRARYINFMLDDDLDVRQFDVLANEIVEASRQVVVLDTGSSNFIPLVSYLKSNRILEVFAELGRRVVIHSVLIGGAGARETLAGLVATAENLPAYGYVAWLNSFFGPVVFEGKQFEETKAFGRVRDKVLGVVRIRQRGGSSNVLHLSALREMTSRYLTYKEALPSPQFTLWDRQRLREAQREIDEQLTEIFGRDNEIQNSAAAAVH